MEVLILYRCLQLGSNFDSGTLKKLQWLYEQDGSVPQRSLYPLDYSFLRMSYKAKVRVKSQR